MTTLNDAGRHKVLGLGGIFVRARDRNAADRLPDTRGVAVGHRTRPYATAEQSLDDNASVTTGTEHDQAHGSSASLAA